MINESQNKYFGKFCDLWLRYRDKECYRELCKYYPSSFYNISEDIQVLFSGLNPSFNEKKIKNKEDFIFSNGKPDKCIDFDTNSLEEYDYFENIRKCCNDPYIEWGFADIFHNRMSSQNEFMQYVNNKVFAEFFDEQLNLYIDILRYIADILERNNILVVFTNKDAFEIFIRYIKNSVNSSESGYELKEFINSKLSHNPVLIYSDSKKGDVNRDLYELYISGRVFRFILIYELVHRFTRKDLKKLAVVKVKELIKEKANV